MGEHWAKPYKSKGEGPIPNTQGTDSIKHDKLLVSYSQTKLTEQCGKGLRVVERWIRSKWHKGRYGHSEKLCNFVSHGDSIFNFPKKYNVRNTLVCFPCLLTKMVLELNLYDWNIWCMTKKNKEQNYNVWHIGSAKVPYLSPWEKNEL